MLLNNFFYYWLIFYKLLSFNYTSKISRNIISFTHSILCFSIANFSNNSNFVQLLVSISYSYFIFDILYILYNKNWNEIAYIYHHLVCLLCLNNLYNNINQIEFIDIFFYGELSNFFNYIVYHLIKNNAIRYKILIFKIIQTIWFSYFRIYIFSNLLNQYFFLLKDRFLAYNLVIIYLMGIGWGINQVTLLYKNIINN